MNGASASSTPPNPPSSVGSFEALVRQGARATVLAQVATQLVSILVLAVLFRIVAPEEFGLIGMATPLLLLGRMLSSLGLNVATVQRETLASGQASTLFWYGLMLAVGGAVVTCGLGPAVAWWCQTPELTVICLALSGTLIVAALGAQHQAILERHMKWNELAAIRVAALATGGVAAIIAAAAGMRVWALVVQQYVELSALALGAWIWEPWRPHAPTRGTPAREMLRMGGYYSASSLLFFLALNLDKLLLAGWLGESASGRAVLGMYTQAFQLMMKPVYAVTTPLTGIMLPVLSRARTDRRAFAKLAARFYRMAAIVLFPSGVGLFLVAQDVVRVLGGGRWDEAGGLLAAFSPTVLLIGLVAISGSVFAAAGRTDRLFLGSLVFTILLVQGFFAGAWIGGRAMEGPSGTALGVAWSFSIVTVLVVGIPYLVFCWRTVEVSPRAVWQAVRGAARATTWMGLVVMTVRWTMMGWTADALSDNGSGAIGDYIRPVASILAGVASYVYLARDECRWLLGQLGAMRGWSRTDD